MACLKITNFYIWLPFQQPSLSDSNTIWIHGIQNLFFLHTDEMMVFIEEVTHYHRGCYLVNSEVFLYHLLQLLIVNYLLLLGG